MTNSLLSLFPPLIVIIFATTTQRMRLSLLIGIISALVITQGFDVINVLSSLVSKLWATTELQSLSSWESFWGGWNIFIILFLCLLGILTTLIHASGGAQAYATFVSRHLKQKQDAESSSLLLSYLFAIDDYFSCLTVGSVMQPVTDRFNIPRAKAAMLVNCMATSLVVLFPISSWAAEIIMQMSRAGLSSVSQAGVLILCNPFNVFLNTIPFTMYAFIVVVSLWVLVRRRYAFAIIRQQEEQAAKTNNLFGGKTILATHYQNPRYVQDTSMIDFIAPIAVLIGGVIFCALYFGNMTMFGGSNNFFFALQNTKIAPSLFVGAMITVIFCSIFLPMRRRLAWESLPNLWLEGIIPMFPSIVMLTLIWTFSGIIKNELGTGNYIAQFLAGNVPISLLPALFFGISAFTSTLIGSSWGAIGIYFPIGVPCLLSLMHVGTPVAINAIPLVYALFGAIISGAIVGNHLAPVSDTLWMATTSSGAYHADVIKMHYAFVLPCVMGAIVSFCSVGIMLDAGANLTGVVVLSLLVGCSTSIGLLGFCDWLEQKRKP